MITGWKAAAALEGDLEVGYFAERGDHLAVDGRGLRGERPHRPPARCGEEPELPGRRRRPLGGELSVAVEQPDVRVAHRLAVADDDPLDDGGISQVEPLRRGPTLGRAAHQGVSPSAMGTPTNEPHSVHEPS